MNFFYYLTGMTLFYFCGGFALAQEKKLFYSKREQAYYFTKDEKTLEKTEAFRKVEKGETFVDGNGKEQTAEIGDIIFKIAGKEYLGKNAGFMYEPEIPHDDRLGAVGGGFASVQHPKLTREMKYLPKEDHPELSADEKELFDAVNAARKNSGLPTLDLDMDLTILSRSVASENEGKQRAALRAGEGLLQNSFMDNAMSRDAQYILKSFLANRTTSQNLLNANLTAMGVGVSGSAAVLTFSPGSARPRTVGPRRR